ncbi:XPG I-region protein [Roridomyces roridus]|uniref:XPG I-region protein n=1 Tax=Roridomyces roridus TaxID=1738132 RepID=A0AAD7F691_9AGAR|nr:XPG I-region protein [Roridomyces roridus]
MAIKHLETFVASHSSLTTRVEADLRTLERLRIKPVFVFTGLSPNRRWKGGAAGPGGPMGMGMGPGGVGNQAEMDACRDRRDAWAKYEAGQEDAATRLFEGRSAFAQWDLWRMVLRIFRHRNVEFMVAPYGSWAQLIYLSRHPKQYIHAIYGPTDILLYPGVDKLITSFDLGNSSLAAASTSLTPTSPSATSGHTPTFTFISKRSLLTELTVTDDQFLDVGILVGCSLSAPFPPTMHDAAVKATVDMVKYYKSGYLAHPVVKSLGYAEQYARVRSMFRYSLILSAEGVVIPLPIALPASAGGAPPNNNSGNNNNNNPQGPGGPGAMGGSGVPTAADVPTDLHEVFTHRLPDEVFYYLSRGLLGPQALVWLTTGQITEGPPLDNGETTEYKRSHGFFWFEQPGPHAQKVVQHNAQQTVQLAERVGGWNVGYAVNSSTIDFALCLGATSSERLAARTKVKAGGAAPLDKKDEVVANVIWRFLELRGVFLLNTHTHSPLARAMYAAIKNSKVNDKFQDPLYLFLELVRAGVMHGHLWSGRAFSGGPSFGTDEEKACMLLVMRVLSIVPLNFKAQPWSAPLSRELLVFNSFVRSLTRALRTLLEVTSLNMLLRNDARRGRDDLLDIALSLTVNTGFGVLGKVYLDALTHINNRTRVRDPNAPGVKEAKAMALEICEETFPGVKYPKLEVERGFRFWDVALTAMRQLHSEGAVLRELIDQFEAAEAWLAPMRP